MAVAGCGTGSADVDCSAGPDLKGALEEVGFEVNEANYVSVHSAGGMGGVENYDRSAFNVNEIPVDVYTEDVKSSFTAYGDVAMVGFYGNYYSNYNAEDTANWYKAPQDLDGNGYYYTYQEGIYVGYRYYETRYEDVVMGTGNAGSYNYASEVAFPFGYGLSYTTFEWSDYAVSYDAAADTFPVTVNVKNTGNVAGKEVVEVYFQSPYTGYDKANGIEKAVIELRGFAKGAKTYIPDAGEYYLTAGKDAHDALNNVLAAKGYTTADLTWKYTQDKMDTTTYSVSASTGNAITNQFDNTELSYYGLEDLTYLSRSDWQGKSPWKPTRLCWLT